MPYYLYSESTNDKYNNINYPINTNQFWVRSKKSIIYEPTFTMHIFFTILIIMIIIVEIPQLWMRVNEPLAGRNRADPMCRIINNVLTFSWRKFQVCLQWKCSVLRSGVVTQPGADYWPLVWRGKHKNWQNPVTSYYNTRK